MKKVFVAFCIVMIPIIGFSQNHSGVIEGAKVNVIVGDITRQSAQGIIVPHFQGEVSYGGVGGAVVRAGGSAALDSAQAMMDRDKKLGQFGSAFLTRSNGMNEAVINVITVGSGAEHEYQTIRQAVLNGLQVAHDNKLSSVAIPALGTGIIGRLSNEQSSHAIMSAIAEHRRNGGSVSVVSIVIYGDRSQAAAFSQSLESKYYIANINSGAKEGQRAIDPVRWASGMANGGVDLQQQRGAAIEAEKIVERQASASVSSPGGWREVVKKIFTGRSRAAK